MTKLFDTPLLRRRIANYEWDSDRLDKQKSLISQYVEALTSVSSIKETSFQGDFLTLIFENILGYNSLVSSPNEFNLLKEYSISGDTSDGGLGFFTPKDKSDCRVVIELKNVHTQLDKKQENRDRKETAVEQGYRYANKLDTCRWIIISNFKILRLYSKLHSLDFYEEFNFEDLKTEEELKKFIYLLKNGHLISVDGESLTEKVMVDSKKLSELITNKFYAHYKEVRSKLLGHLIENNPGKDKVVLLEKTQKLLDRLIFVFFCENSSSVLLDKGLSQRVFDSAKNIFSDDDQKLWNQFKLLFNSIDKGNDTVSPKINAYDGGLFSYDDILNNLVIKDPIWKDVISLNDYDYQSQLDVNVLGHIFENSVSDLEQMKAEISGQNADKKKSRRKKEGIYYTPEYITRYIVENTIGQILEKDPLAITNIKIADISCGSGAFLNQTHSFLFNKSHEFYEQGLLKSENFDIGGLFDYNPIEVERSILLNNLYGVDINQESVEITKLALWLKTANKNKPLQNLDMNIKCGNSLIDDPSVAGEKAFNWYKEFPEIMQNGGFDVIIGNPPYIKEYTNRHAFDGLRSSPYYQGKMDLWTMFACKSIDLLKDGGYLSFIAPNNWTTNAGASIFRNKILSEGEILSFIDFGDFKVFEDAGIQTMIFVFRKCIPRLEYSVKYLKVVDKKIDQSVLNLSLQSNLNVLSEQYISYEAVISPKRLVNSYLDFSNPKINSLCNKISRSRSFLAKNEIAQGIVCPQDTVVGSHIDKFKNTRIGDGIFVLNEDEMQKIKLAASDFELSHIKPYFTSDQLGRFYSNPINKKWIIYTKSDVNEYIDDLPNIKTHLDKYSPIITSDNKPYGLHRAREEAFFTGDKIMSLRKCSEPTFSFTSFNCYVSQSYFIIKTERFNLKYLTLLLNSTLIKFWLLNKGKRQGDLFQIDKEPLLNIPLIDADKKTQLSLAQLHDQIADLYAQYYDKNIRFGNFLKNEYRLPNIKKLNDISLLNWEDLTGMLERHSHNLDPLHKERLMVWLSEKQEELKLLKYEIARLENQIDRFIYNLYDLVQDEIEIIESSCRTT